MKIYKSTLAQLLNEARPPFYLSNSRTMMDGKLPQCLWTVQLSGRNQEGEMCELYLQTGAVYAFDQNGCNLAQKQSETWTQELRTRLEALNLEIRDGRVSENQPMAGIIE